MAAKGMEASNNAQRALFMSELNLTEQDVDYIGRVVATEVPHHIRSSHPQEYARMVAAVTDTILNRVASPDFPSTVEGVLNENRAFSKITGPSRLSPYGSVDRAPSAPDYVQNIVTGHLQSRLDGAPSIVGDSLHYANPNHSDRRNLEGWINPMIEAGAQRFGVGDAVHYHGTEPSRNWRSGEVTLGNVTGMTRQSGPQRPDPANDFNAQELEAIAPPTPATPSMMTAAMTPQVPNPTARPNTPTQAPSAPLPGAPMQERTLGGYIANQPGFEVKPGATVDGLSPAAQNMLDLMANSNAGQFTVTEGRRPQNATYGAANSLHKSGDALDVRRRNLTEAQNVALLEAGLAGGGRELIFYPESSGGHVHMGARPSGRFSVSGPIPDYARQSPTFNRLQAGEQPRISTMVPGPMPRSAAMQSNPAPLASPNANLTSYERAALSSMDAARAAPITPVISQALPAPQSMGSQRIDQAFSDASRNTASGGSFSDNSARINQAFNAALSPDSRTQPQFRVSQASTYSSPQPRSPDQFQYETRTRQVANPAYEQWERGNRQAVTNSSFANQSAAEMAMGRAPAPAPVAQTPAPPRTIQETYRVAVPVAPAAPAGPSKQAMLTNYGNRALQGVDPFAAPTATPFSIPGPSVPAPSSQFGNVPNPVARPVDNSAIVLPAQPPSAPRNPRQTPMDGISDFLSGMFSTDRIAPMAGTALGGMIGGPIGAALGGLGGMAFNNYQANQPMSLSPTAAARQGFVQGSNRPTQNTPNWQDNTGLPTYASVTGNSGGTGASAHDAWADSLGSAFY
jgi:hypothetical protein